jgi:dihydrofolate reductase
VELALIYARSENRCIGKDGGLPWRLPDDMAFFERTTLGNPVIMGRRTYEERRSPLPGRLNIVVSRKEGYEVAEGVLLADSVDTAISHAQAHSRIAFIIGGVQLYADAFPRSNLVFETLVHADVTGDAFLPEFDYGDWQTDRLFVHEVDARHPYAFSVLRHSRNAS